MNCQVLYHQDESRVNLRFKEAHSKGIPIETQMLSFAELLIHLERGGLAIVLADANLLMCQTCRSLRHNLGNMVKSLLHAKLPFIGKHLIILYRPLNTLQVLSTQVTM